MFQPKQNIKITHFALIRPHQLCASELKFYCNSISWDLMSNIGQKDGIDQLYMKLGPGSHEAVCSIISKHDSIEQEIPITVMTTLSLRFVRTKTFKTPL